jgi:hypothetical protein
LTAKFLSLFADYHGLLHIRGKHRLVMALDKFPVERYGFFYRGGKLPLVVGGSGIAETVSLHVYGRLPCSWQEKDAAPPDASWKSDILLYAS